MVTLVFSGGTCSWATLGGNYNRSPKLNPALDPKEWRGRHSSPDADSISRSSSDGSLALAAASMTAGGLKV